MHVERITRTSDLHQLRSDWQRLAGAQPLRGPDWLHSWWDHFGDGNELWVLAVRQSSGALVGVAPWFVESRAAQGRVVQFLGSGMVCTDYLGLLCEPGLEADVVSAIATWMLEAGRGGGPDRWDMLELVGVAAAEPTCSLLVERLAADCGDQNTRAGLNCWRLELPTSWEEYLGRLSKSYRKIARRNLDSFQSGRVTLRTAETPGEFRQGWELLVDLHQRRRTSQQDSGCFADPRFEAFLLQAAERLFQNAALHLSWVEVAGRPAAIDFGLRNRQELFLYQSGVDVEMLEESPGNLLTSLTISQAIARGLTAIDFLRGDEPYKSYWRATPQPMAEYRLVAPRSVSVLRNRVWSAARQVKHWLHGKPGEAGSESAPGDRTTAVPEGNSA